MIKAKAYLHEYVFIYYLMNIIMRRLASSLMCSMFKSSFMKHNPSLLLFLFIHRLKEIPQFHLLLFSVILSKMKINPLFYVRCELMRECVSWSFWSRPFRDYVIQRVAFHILWHFTYYVRYKFSLNTVTTNHSKFLKLYYRTYLYHKNMIETGLLSLALRVLSSCLKGFELLILA